MDKDSGLNAAGVTAALAGDFDNAAVAFTEGGIEAQEASARDGVAGCGDTAVIPSCSSQSTTPDYTDPAHHFKPLWPSDREEAEGERRFNEFLRRDRERQRVREEE